MAENKPNLNKHDLEAGEQRAQEILEEAELGGRRLRGFSRWLVGGVAVTWSLFQLWATWTGTLDPFILRAAHLAFAFALVFLIYPFGKSAKGRIPWYDWIIGAVATVSAVYVIVQYNSITQLQGGLPNATDSVMGSLTVLLLLFAAWRSLGPALPIVALVFILYGAIGPRGILPFELPPLLQLHAGMQWEQIVGQLYVNTEGIFGTPIGVSATFVFLFVLFGALFDRMGAGEWFMNVSHSLLGAFRGGPAKAAVVSSALNGIVSGSSVSNVVTGGNITIPLMQKVGYSAEKAGGIEVASSSNGQLMPPVMGAAAFIMAEYLQIPYATLILAAAIPAFLCYAGLIVVVHIEALKLNLKGVPRSELPKLGPVLRSGAHYILPIGYLIYALTFMNLTPERAALNTILLMLPLILIQEVYRSVRARNSWAAGLRQGAEMIVSSFEVGARNMVGIAIATAAAGIIVGMVTVTGIGFGLTDIVEAVSGGNLIIVLIMAQLISLLLGMGLPTTANYIVMATLVVPVILNLARASGYEVPPLAAHMFVFYFGIMADSTPPVALAAFAASAISGGDPIKTGVQGFVYELRTALLAYMMFFNPQLLLIGVNSFGEGAWITVTAFMGMVAFAAATLGFLHRRTNILERLVLLASALLLITPGFTTDLFGFAALGGVYLWQKLRAPRLRGAV
ncbi:TRAP transporter 4TM/12TM fusion protein [Deinobacterium chartae]|uniref:TRAP transporter 4TM/12TM fusion protein n=1 Tax=Deinobacterium chartae TaxID=521158 RepID=A0A841HYU2_9DEIO|nr:TRAP transporter permease [Deinobacterium chartae]MBB6098046.1 TRAP transporter 4TM/12TM fusion protein [Deinobacterium chartae]